jgi:hypothetical protein
MTVRSASATGFRYVLADSVAFLNPDHWDRVTARSGLFLSRSFLHLLEQNQPRNLSTHYALAYREDEPVAAVVAQSLDIRVADLSAGHTPQEDRRFWHSLEEAAERSFSLARKRILFLDNVLPWKGPEAGGEESELWPDVARDLGRRWWELLKFAERAAELPVSWVHQRFLICGNVLTTGPHGVAFADGRNPAELWPAVVEALARIQRSSTLFGESDLVMIKDLTEEQTGAAAALKRFHFRRFETEPEMSLPLKSAWTCFDDYLQDMKSNYRGSIRKTLQELEASGIVMTRLDPGEVEQRRAEIHGLYLQVHERQKLRLVTIGEGWIPALARHFQDDFRTIAARRPADGKLLGFVTIIRDAPGALGYYIGFDRATASAGIPLYLGLVYAAVGQAIEMGASSMRLGRTALGPKAQIGAKPQAMCGFLRHRSPALNLAVPTILAFLPEPQQPPERHPFKE